jgi:diguanylate cyclase (GGDEF)-like protein
MTQTSSADLLPLADRMRVMRVLRIAFAAIVLGAWTALPETRGASLPAVAGVTAGYLVALGAADAAWSVSRRRGQSLFGFMLMADAVYLAWASYGTAGLDTPVRNLILIQLITVALIASMRTGMKLAMWSSMLLVGAYHLHEVDLLGALGNPDVRFGAGGYREIIVDVAVFWLVAMVTSTFTAVNERELRRRRYDLEALAQLSLRLERADGSAGVAAILAEAAADTFDYPRVLVAAAPEQDLQVLALHGSEGGAAEPIDSPLLRRAMAAPRSLLVPGGGDDAALAVHFPDARNLALVALRAEGRAIGVIVVEHGMRGGSRIEARVVTMLERFASHAALALVNAWLLDEVRRSASTDALTGLANRRQLDQALARECAETVRSQVPLAVLMIDLDHFKRLNDVHGHQAGDRALRLAAMAIATSTRTMDLAARYGGEEFCVAMPGVDAAGAANAAERIRRAIERVSPDLPFTASVGVASAPAHGSTATEITAAADAALYDAKHAGRNRVSVCTTRRETAA